MHINSMPDLVLRRIFSKVPLRDMIWIGRVCPLWRSYQMKIGKQVRSLTLLIGSPLSMITKSRLTLKYHDLLLNDDGTRMYSSQHLPKHFHLTFGSFPLDGAAQVLNIFPHITTLEVAINAQIELDSLISLLIHWSLALKSLKMYFRQNETPSKRSIMLVLVETKEGKIVNLLKVINSLSSLEHLTLYYHGALFSKSPCDLSILGQLYAFHLDSLDHHSSIVKSLEKYAVKNENLKQISLEMLSGILPTFYHKFPQLQNKVVFLSTARRLLGNLIYHIRNLIQDILPFNSITLLRLEPDRDENIFTGALNFLASLKQLVHLGISFDSGYFASLQSQNQHKVSRDKIVQLSSIKVLILCSISYHEYLNFASNCESQVNNWAHLFPNVQVIELISFCSIHDFTREAKIRKSLTTFVHCPKLCYLYTYELGFDYVPSRYREWIVVQFRGRKIVCGDVINGPVY